MQNVEQQQIQMQHQRTEQVLISVRDLVRFFPPKYRVLNLLSFEVYRGECLRVIGKSGSGKSILVRTMIGVDRPDSGEVFWDGVPLSELPETDIPKERQRRFAILGRDGGFLKRLSMEENLMFTLVLSGSYGGLGDSRKKIREAMERFGIANAAIRRPSRLSRQEMCRMQLARASLAQPQVLIADDFLTGLTAEENREIWNLLKGWQNDTSGTLIQLTDDEKTYGEADRLLYLRGGRLWEE